MSQDLTHAMKLVAGSAAGKIPCLFCFIVVEINEHNSLQALLSFTGDLPQGGRVQKETVSAWRSPKRNVSQARLPAGSPSARGGFSGLLSFTGACFSEFQENHEWQESLQNIVVSCFNVEINRHNGLQALLPFIGDSPRGGRARTSVLSPPPFWPEQDAPERAGDPAKRVARKQKPSGSAYSTRAEAVNVARKQQ